VGTDAPDWERVVTTISGGSVSDAPDWQRTVTGPGAAPIGGGGSPFTPGVSVPGQVASTMWLVSQTVNNTSSALGPSSFYGYAVTVPVALTTATVGMTYSQAASAITGSESGFAVYQWDSSLSEYTLNGSAYNPDFSAGLVNNLGYASLSMSLTTPIAAGSVVWLAVLVNGVNGLAAYYRTLMTNRGLPSMTGRPYMGWFQSPPTAFPASLAIGAVTAYSSAYYLDVGP